MVRVSPTSVSQASGEISKLMHGRPDYVRFQNGLAACRGFLPLPEGAVCRLPGTRFLGFTHDNKPAALRAFVFRDEDAVLLEFTDMLLRFWRNSELVENAGIYTLPTPYPVEEAEGIKSVTSGDRVYMVSGERRPHRLSRLALDNWVIEPTPFENGPFQDRNLDDTREMIASGETGTVELRSTFDFFEPHHVGTQMELRESNTSNIIYWSADTKTWVDQLVRYEEHTYRNAGYSSGNARNTSLTAPTVRPEDDEVFSGKYVKFSKTGGVYWDIVAEGNDGGYPIWEENRPVSVGDRRFHDGYTIEVVGLSGGSGNTGVNPPVHTEGFWLSGSGDPVWEHISDGIGVVEILSITDARTAEVEVKKRLPASVVVSGTYRWSAAAWSDERGWPKAISAYEQRHAYGGTREDPRTIWHSVIGGTVDMEAGTKDDDGFSYIMASDQRDNGIIRAMVGKGGVLFILTTAGEFYGTKSDADRAYAAETATYADDTTEGAADLEPIIAHGRVLYLSKTRRRLLMPVQNENRRWEIEDLTQLARHILGRGARKLVFQKEPVSIVWAVRDDGQLASLTFNPRQQVLGWGVHDLAGGKVRDIEVMPTADGLAEELVLCIERQLNGQTRHCIEVMQQPFIDLDGVEPDVTDAWHQFCGHRWTGAATNSVPVLSHLEGERVTAWTDTGAHSGLLVENGRIEIPGLPVTTAIIGLDASVAQRIDTLEIIPGSADGGSDGRLRTIRALAARLHRTADGFVQIGYVDRGRDQFTAPQRLFDFEPFTELALRDQLVDVRGLKQSTLQSFLRITPAPGAPLTLVSRTPTLMVSDS